MSDLILMLFITIACCALKDLLRPRNDIAKKINGIVPVSPAPLFWRVYSLCAGIAFETRKWHLSLIHLGYGAVFYELIQPQAMGRSDGAE